MNHVQPVTRVLMSAFKFAGRALIGLIILSTIFVLPFYGPFGGLAILLYYGAFVVFYFVPFVLLIGAIIGFGTLFTSRLNVKKKKRPSSRLTPISIIGIIGVFGLIFSYIALPHFTLGQIDYVEHSATWFYVNPYDEDVPIYEKDIDECEIQLVLFRLEAYHHYDFVCDQEILSYLETLENDRVRLTYRVTSDFGDIRGWGLESVGTIPVSARAWISSFGGCGGVYTHSCDAPNVSHESHLLISTWSNE